MKAPAARTRMNRRHKINLGIGVALLAAGIIIFAILKIMEGNVVVKDGQELVYTVDPNVYVVMLVIALLGVLIIFLTVADYRWRIRGNETDVSFTDLIRSGGKKPVPKTPGTVKGKIPKPNQRDGQVETKVTAGSKNDGRPTEPGEKTCPGSEANG